ncbi:hypothetical protein C8J56DRAFT_1024227, partial [Mycena floridula]
MSVIGLRSADATESVMGKAVQGRFSLHTPGARPRALLLECLTVMTKALPYHSIRFFLISQKVDRSTRIKVMIAVMKITALSSDADTSPRVVQARDIEFTQCHSSACFPDSRQNPDFVAVEVARQGMEDCNRGSIIQARMCKFTRSTHIHLITIFVSSSLRAVA